MPSMLRPRPYLLKISPRPASSAPRRKKRVSSPRKRKIKKRPYATPQGDSRDCPSLVGVLDMGNSIT